MPNSFLKRRFNIESGKQGKGVKKYIFFIYDQIDSIVGILLVLWSVYHYSFLGFIMCIVFGIITHLVINIGLYLLKIRKNIL